MRTSALHAVTIILAFISGMVFGDSTGRTNDGNRETLTDSLVVDFHGAWNRQDMQGMRERLLPTAFFRSPHQLRYGRETMESTVLGRNPYRFRNVVSTEQHSFVSDNLAWSIGELRSEVFGADGKPTGDRGGSDYLYVFTPDGTGAWKVQMLVYHEECE